MPVEQFTYNWDVTKLESTAQVGNYSDVVTRIFWTLWGFDEHNNSVPLYGETEVNVDSLSSGRSVDGWVDYKNLTKETVENMIEDILGEDEIARLTDNLKIQLEQLQQHKTTTQIPPWVL
jgi:hypothetical protein